MKKVSAYIKVGLCIIGIPSVLYAQERSVNLSIEKVGNDIIKATINLKYNNKNIVVVTLDQQQPSAVAIRSAKGLPYAVIDETFFPKVTSIINSITNFSQQFKDLRQPGKTLYYGSTKKEIIPWELQDTAVQPNSWQEQLYTITQKEVDDAAAGVFPRVSLRY
ncbi:MAG TPA: hypothetical protein VGW78_01845 [Candidatus Babeliales bacterium]|jgi:hypothetical protein|nr:hypothetical protein [Candidatus Babeliales bacterium]